MFTGLIEKLGEVVEVCRGDGGGTLKVRIDPWSDLVQGESIGIQGVCLTLTQHESGVLQFDLLKETFDRTNLGDKQVGDAVNVERALRYGDTMGGHIVSGHVDGPGEMTCIEEVPGGDRVLHVTSSPALMSDVIPKGSITIDGVSLTVVRVEPDSFTVHIIPHTWTHTSFHALKEGDRVNLETDVLAKYARSVLRAEGQEAPELSWETLERLGRGTTD